ncbi:MAG: hypothetical protein E6I75_13135 [Chloroflexi bacterium]|nr:MAG: hypothetical protein E6I75_13135 [Chloroflexota bacterium]
MPTTSREPQWHIRRRSSRSAPLGSPVPRAGSTRPELPRRALAGRCAGTECQPGRAASAGAGRRRRVPRRRPGPSGGGPARRVGSRGDRCAPARRQRLRYLAAAMASMYSLRTWSPAAVRQSDTSWSKLLIGAWPEMISRRPSQNAIFATAPLE